MGSRTVWNERKISSLIKKGYGQGEGSLYKPWISVEGTSSKGRVRRVWSAKTGRTHHLLSDIEHSLFLALEWQLSITDIREQYPLPREVTQTIAKDIGVRHPCYPGTHVAAVMTTDFMVTETRKGSKVSVAYDAKDDPEAENEVSISKLEIQREYCARLDIEHHLVFRSQIPKSKIENIQYVRDALLKELEQEPSPGYYEGLCDRMFSDIASHPAHIPLNRYCQDFDARFGAIAGTGLRVARMLMEKRVLIPNLASSHLHADPISAFIVAGQLGRLRAVGGR